VTTRLRANSRRSSRNSATMGEADSNGGSEVRGTPI
jgi:hypothetical protein